MVVTSLVDVMNIVTHAVRRRRLFRDRDRILRELDRIAHIPKTFTEGTLLRAQTAPAPGVHGTAKPTNGTAAKRRYRTCTSWQCAASSEAVAELDVTPTDFWLQRKRWIS